MNKADDFGCTPLHYAADKGNVAIIKMLIKAGANLNVADKGGCTPLFSASTIEVAIELLDNGADAKVVNLQGQSLLTVAKSEAMVNLLVEHGTEFGAQVPLYLEVQKLYYMKISPCYQLNVAVMEDDIQLAKLICEQHSKDIDINLQYFEFGTVLLLAAEKGFTELVEIFVNMGATLEVAGRETAIFIAAKNGHLETFNLLFKLGARLDQRMCAIALEIIYGKGHISMAKELCLHCNEDVSALFNALFEGKLHNSNLPINKELYDEVRLIDVLCTQGKLEEIKVLLDLGVSVSENCLFRASKAGYAEVVRLLLDSKKAVINDNVVLVAANSDVVKVLADYGAKFNMKSTSRLEMAVHLNELEVMGFLGEREDLETALCGGETALHIAASRGKVELVQILLYENFVNANSTSSNAKTPLHGAARCGNLAIVKLLLDCDADVNAVDDFGYTPLTIAAQWGHNEVVKELVEKGAIVHSYANDLTHPISYANNLDWKTVKMLIERGEEQLAKGVMQRQRGDMRNTEGNF